MKVELESAFPEGTNLIQQFEKLQEEVTEVEDADLLEEIAKESLDVATVAIGLFELSVEQMDRNNQKLRIEITRRLLQEHHEKLLDKEEK